MHFSENWICPNHKCVKCLQPNARLERLFECINCHSMYCLNHLEYGIHPIMSVRPNYVLIDCVDCIAYRGVASRGTLPFVRHSLSVNANPVNRKFSGDGDMFEAESGEDDTYDASTENFQLSTNNLMLQNFRNKCTTDTNNNYSFGNFPHFVSPPPKEGKMDHFQDGMEYDNGCSYYNPYGSIENNRLKKSNSKNNDSFPNDNLLQLTKDFIASTKILQKSLAYSLGVSPSTLSSYMTKKTRRKGWNSFEAKLQNYIQENKRNDITKDTPNGSLSFDHGPSSTMVAQTEDDSIFDGIDLKLVNGFNEHGCYEVDQ